MQACSLRFFRQSFENLQEILTILSAEDERINQIKSNLSKYITSFKTFDASLINKEEVFEDILALHNKFKNESDEKKNLVYSEIAKVCMFLEKYSEGFHVLNYICDETVKNRTQSKLSQNFIRMNKINLAKLTNARISDLQTYYLTIEKNIFNLCLIRKPQIAEELANTIQDEKRKIRSLKEVANTYNSIGKDDKAHAIHQYITKYLDR